MVYIALLLGMIEGMTEFLPVSSTGHLIIFGELLGFQGPDGKAFEIMIQLGAILAICWLYRKKLSDMMRGVIKGNAADRRFALGIMLALLPAMIMGGLFHRFIKDVLFNPFIVSIALIVGGIVILLVERRPVRPRYHALEQLPLSLCFKIGLCQCLALIPGTSRSGATIIGALIWGAERKVAAEFSFFLAIPTMFAATLFNLYESRHTLNFDDAELIAAGFAAAFISALLVVRLFMAFISRHGFAPFAYYRIALGLFMLYVFQA